MTVLPLLPSGLCVVELGDSIAGSVCGRFLGHLGASVTKVEAPGGSALRGAPPFVPSPSKPGVSALFAALNAGKHVETADIATPDGRAFIEDLVCTRADVVVMSGRLREWKACEMSPGRLRAMSPRLIAARVTMFGDDGPYADIAGGELQALALGGLMNMVGGPEREPLRLGGYQAQHSAGLALLAGVALALYRRDTQGTGSAFSTSVLETVCHIEWKGAVNHQAGNPILARRSEGPGPECLILRCRDGFFVFSYGPHTWRPLREILDEPRLDAAEFATPELRELNRPALLRLMNERTEKMAKRDLYRKTQEVGILSGYLASVSELFASEQYRLRSFFEPLDLGASGQGIVPGAPWKIYEGRAPE